MVPGSATAQFNLRYSPASTHTDLIHRIEAIAHRYASKNETALAWHLSAEPFSSQPGPLRDAVMHAVQSTCGIEAAANTAGGTSDGRFIAPLGAEVVELGPVNASIHQANECIDVAELNQLSNLYEATLLRLAAVVHEQDQ
ncbi:MAG: M20/M25/M40 family metallo-hydrolase, partial [Gammaproteobacteria bacterium]|nr:M20/M25/M40 family metallo-hydrolase [Gammaproteobacteria bacterium]